MHKNRADRRAERMWYGKAACLFASCEAHDLPTPRDSGTSNFRFLCRQFFLAGIQRRSLFRDHQALIMNKAIGVFKVLLRITEIPLQGISQENLNMSSQTYPTLPLPTHLELV